MNISGGQLPSGQEWLLERMALIFPNINPRGICFGLAHMAKQAILLDDLDTFKRRLKLIYSIPVDKFNETIQEIHQQRMNIIRLVKEKMGGFRKLNENEINFLETHKDIRDHLILLENTINSLIEDGKLKETDKFSELQNRRDTFLFNALVQKNIEAEKLRLSKDDRIRLDIPIFFEGIELYQQIFKHPELFAYGEQPQAQNDEVSALLAASAQLENEAGIRKIDRISGIYTQDELETYFDSLKDSISNSPEPVTKPVACVLNCSDHAITIGYDPRRKQWSFIDAAQLDLLVPLNTQQLSEQVMDGLTRNDFTSFTTEIYTDRANEERCKQCISQWKKLSTWQNIHDPAGGKSVLADSDGASWLYIASQIGDNEVIKELTTFMNKDSIDQACRNGATPLFIATQNNHLGSVKLLLDANANPDTPTPEAGITPLLWATMTNNTSIADVLLNKAANPNLPTTNGETALLWAVEAGNASLVSTLLTHHADPNLSLSDGISPLFIAAQNGQTDIVKLLLEVKNINVDIPLKINVDKLRELGEALSINETMEKFIQSKQSSPSLRKSTSDIKITAAEIAAVLGHTEIAALIKKYKQQNKFSLFAKKLGSLKDKVITEIKSPPPGSPRKKR